MRPVSKVLQASGRTTGLLFRSSQQTRQDRLDHLWPLQWFLLATGRPDLAVKTRSGAIWKDREGLAWTDPFRKEVWDYNIALALEAAEHGFDEIQFDYVRFPDARGLV